MYVLGMGINIDTRMNASTTAIEDRKCPPAIIPELAILPNNGLLLHIEYRTATVQP